MDQMYANPDLADFLVNHKACSRELANDISSTSEEGWVPLGMILINSGKLNMRQVGAILSAQADAPGKLFGNQAIELGHITQEELAEALAAQADQCPHVLDLALGNEGVDQKILILAVREYIRFNERTLARISDSLIVPVSASR